MSTISERLSDERRAIFGDRPLVTGGPVDEERYLDSSPRLLFIGKDANDGNDTSSSWQLNAYCCERVGAILETNRWGLASYFQTIGKWAWGIHNRFNRFYEDLDARNAAEGLRRVAITNLKKTAGGGVADMEAVRQEVLNPEGRQYLMAEIRLLAPDIVICGGSNTFNILMAALDGQAPSPCEELAMRSGRRAACFQGFLAEKPLVVLDFWHPSARLGGAAAYAHLKEVHLDLSRWVNLG